MLGPILGTLIFLPLEVLLSDFVLGALDVLFVSLDDGVDSFLEMGQ